MVLFIKTVVHCCYKVVLLRYSYSCTFEILLPSMVNLYVPHNREREREGSGSVNDALFRGQTW